MNMVRGGMVNYDPLNLPITECEFTDHGCANFALCAIC